MEKVIGKNLKQSDADSKLKAMLQEKSQPETEESQVYYGIMQDLYEYGDINFKLECWKPECFDKIISGKLHDKQFELINKKNHFLDDTQNIFKHIRVEDSTQYNADLQGNDDTDLHFGYHSVSIL